VTQGAGPVPLASHFLQTRPDPTRASGGCRTRRVSHGGDLRIDSDRGRNMAGRTRGGRSKCSNSGERPQCEFVRGAAQMRFERYWRDCSQAISRQDPHRADILGHSVVWARRGTRDSPAGRPPSTGTWGTLARGLGYVAADGGGCTEGRFGREDRVGDPCRVSECAYIVNDVTDAIRFLRWNHPSAHRGHATRKPNLRRCSAPEVDLRLT